MKSKEQPCGGCDTVLFHNPIHTQDTQNHFKSQLLNYSLSKKKEKRNQIINNHFITNLITCLCSFTYSKKYWTKITLFSQQQQQQQQQIEWKTTAAVTTTKTKLGRPTHANYLCENTVWLLWWNLGQAIPFPWMGSISPPWHASICCLLTHNSFPTNRGSGALRKPGVAPYQG